MRVIKGLLILIIIIFWGNKTFAGNVTPDEYNVTIKKIEMRNQATGSFTTVKEADLSFNIASATAGATVGSYISGAAIPEGTYDQVRVTVSRNFGVRATDGTYYTTTSTSTANLGESGTATVATISTVATDYNNGSEGTCSVPSGVSGVDTTAGTFVNTMNLSPVVVVKKGATQSAKITFDVTNKATFDTTNLYCYLQAPGVSIE